MQCVVNVTRKGWWVQRRGFAPSPLRFVWWNEHAGAAGGGGRPQPAAVAGGGRGAALPPEAYRFSHSDGSRFIFKPTFQIFGAALELSEGPGRSETAI